MSRPGPVKRGDAEGAENSRRALQPGTSCLAGQPKSGMNAEKRENAEQASNDIPTGAGRVDCIHGPTLTLSGMTTL